MLIIYYLEHYRQILELWQVLIGMALGNFKQFMIFSLRI